MEPNERDRNNENETQQYEAIVAFAGITAGDRSDTIARAAASVECYLQGLAPRIIFSGNGPIHVPARLTQLSHAELMREYAIDHSVPPKAVHTEMQSRTLWEGFWNMQQADMLHPGKKYLIVADHKSMHRALTVGYQALGETYHLEGYGFSQTRLPYIIYDAVMKQADRTIWHNSQPGSQSMKTRMHAIFGRNGHRSLPKIAYNTVRLAQQVCRNED